MGVSTRRTNRASPKVPKASTVVENTPKKAAKKVNKTVSKLQKKTIDNLDDVITEFHDTNAEFDHFLK